MELLKGIEAKDLALVIGNNLVMSDTHIGFEEALTKQGIMVPRSQLKDLLQRLEKIIGNNYFDNIIILGDVKHEFGQISDQEWRDTLKLLDFLGEHCKKIILVKGNHDTILGPIARKRNIEVVQHFMIRDIYLCHGDKVPADEDFKKAKTLVIGHEHPAISLTEGSKSEKYKCYLVGKFRRKELIVMPSFLLTHEGTDVLKEKVFSPMIKNIRDFRVIVVADTLLDFGKIGKLT